MIKLKLEEEQQHCHRTIYKCTMAMNLLNLFKIMIENQV